MQDAIINFKEMLIDSELIVQQAFIHTLILRVGKKCSPKKYSQPRATKPEKIGAELTSTQKEGNFA